MKMNKELKMMWAFLTAGTFMLFSVGVLVTASQLAQLPQGWFTVAAIGACMFSSGMFVLAFICGVDYAKEKLNTP